MKKKKINGAKYEMDRVYQFEVAIEGDILSGESFPIYDEEQKKLLGGFALKNADVIFGFISGINHSAALFVSTGEVFYFTPREDLNGKVAYGVISELPISPLSVEINNCGEISNE